MIVTAWRFVYRAELNSALARVPETHPNVTGWGAWTPGLFWLPWGVALTVATVRLRAAPAGRAALSENSQTAPLPSRR